MYSVENSAFLPLTKLVVSMRVGENKVIAYFGLGKYDNVFELYDVLNDPEELEDLSNIDQTTLNKVKEQLLDSLADANRLYETQ